MIKDQSTRAKSKPRANGRRSSRAKEPPLSLHDRLLKISQYYYREADQCAKSRAYFSACILAGAALEAMLLSMCYVEARHVRGTSLYKQKVRNKKFKFKRNRFLEFNLYEMINIAAELKWIPSNEIRLGRSKTTLHQLLHDVRHIRNMIHPSVWSKNGGPEKVYKRSYVAVYKVIDLTREWLLQRVELSLRQRMHREGILIKD